MNLVYKIALVLLIGAVSCKGKEKNQPLTSNQPEFEIDSIKLTGLDNKPIDLKQYRGKTIFINFWATWCRPCLEEMPYIKKAMGLLKGKEIVFLFASDETPEEIENFKNDHDYPFNYVRVENSVELNIMGLPTTFIFNPGGKLVFSDMGFRKWDADENIELILNPVK